MSTPTVVATVSGADGFETCYVSFKSVIDSDGQLTGTPTVTSGDTSRLTVGTPLLTFAGTLNGTTYVAGEIFTFIATAAANATGTVPVTIVYQTPKRKETVRVHVTQQEYEV